MNQCSSFIKITDLQRKIGMRTIHHGKTYIGIDNGISGSIGIIPFSGANPMMILTPTFSVFNYTKQVKKITRIDTKKLQLFLTAIKTPFAVIERPMVNPGRFQATLSALRALEATLIVIEGLHIPYQFIDSRQWQKAMLPQGIKGSNVLKAASLDIGKRLFPQFSHKYKGDADGILMAEWARRERL